MKTGKPTILFCLRFILSCFVFLFFPAHSVYGQEHNEIQNILIINSYHQSLTWTRDETEGIMDTLLESGHNFYVQIENMDWKRHASSENLDYLYQYYKYKYQKVKTDIIITTDDAALQFALNNRKELFSDAPIVFCGVNNDGIESITRNHDRVTGVMEVIEPTETIKFALQINPELKNIYLVYDNSESGLSTGNIVRNKIISFMPQLNIISCNTMTYDNLIKTAEKLSNDSIILLTTYYSDVNNAMYEMDFVNRDISEHSSVPVYHLYDYGLYKGVIGGSMLSGRSQGEAAADIALQFLHGTKLEELPIVTSVPNRTVFDYSQLVRFHIPLSSIPKNVELINRPFSFFKTYKTIVISVASAFFILLLFVLLLLFYIKKINRMKNELISNHEELTQIYEELAASDEEMKQQYDQMLFIHDKIRVGEEKLTFLAYHDSLTGLPNKLSLYDNAKQILVSESGKIALLFIDIDNFKNVNDTIGHAIGDQLIIMISERLSRIVAHRGFLYRLSGDEFIILLTGIQSPEEYKQFAAEVLSRFNEEFIVDTSVLHISLSMGIALYPDHGEELEQLLKYADIAMYRAKDSGRKNFILYDSFMNDAFTERINIEKYLMKALGNNEFELYFQPQYDIINNRITGLEALLRWHSPELGNVPPIKFIPIAEDTRFIIPLGLWVFREACKVLNNLQEQGYSDLTISVNISILQLLQIDFFDIVDRIMTEWGIAPHQLELEITETIFIESFDTIWPKLKMFHDKNMRIALDDFGKGYSSLYYLKHMPISTLKIDKSFVDNIRSKNDNDLTEHIITIGKSMNMCVIAEGVETEEQLEYLIEHGCDKIQGYLFSKPVPVAELLVLLKSNT